MNRYFVRLMMVIAAALFMAAGMTRPLQATTLRISGISGIVIGGHICTGGWANVSGRDASCTIGETGKAGTTVSGTQGTTLSPYATLNSVTYDRFFNSTGAKVTAITLKLWVCKGIQNCTMNSGTSLLWGNSTENVEVNAQFPDLTFAYTAARYSYLSMIGGCYTLSMNGKEYRPTSATSSVWCSDAIALSTTDPTCKLSSMGSFDLDFLTVERSTLGSTPSGNAHGIWVELYLTGCPYATTGNITVSNVIDDGAGNGLIKTSLDGLGVAVRLQNEVMKSDGKLTPAVNVGTNYLKFAFILVNTKGDKLPAGDFSSSAVLTIDFP